MSADIGESRLQVEQAQTDRQHIFAVDMARDFRELVQALFQAEQFVVTTIDQMAWAFDHIVVFQPDVVIVDLVPNNSDGLALLEKLHREGATQDIPVVLTSTSPQLLERAQADVARYGHHPVVAKPCDIDDLVRTVREMIGPA